ncbi:type II toxin-antitoxin system RelE family toxin [Cupriavidus alkaliphilus]|uniref:type II toxin-antitoxin system RelE family toxin n=1 Tax=Cupriavidus alkaliphilus TaxID=942866 RepID=UPI000DD7248C
MHATKPCRNDRRKDPRTCRRSLRAKPERQKARGPRRLSITGRDWRVLYEIENGRLVILVLAISPRGGAYK